jgi:hypothetical protein
MLLTHSKEVRPLRASPKARPKEGTQPDEYSQRQAKEWLISFLRFQNPVGNPARTIDNPQHPIAQPTCRIPTILQGRNKPLQRPSFRGQEAKALRSAKGQGTRTPPRPQPGEIIGHSPPTGAQTFTNFTDTRCSQAGPSQPLPW